MNQPTKRSDDARPICDYEGSTYRSDFWEGQGREYEDRVERVALARLLPARGQRLLDVGAGFGRLADLYAAYKQVILLDYSRSQLEYARQRLGDERFLYVAADIYRLPLADCAVDTTVMVRVLHHLADVPLALQHLARVTRPQGTLVLEFANKRHLKNILRYLLVRGVNPFDPQPYEFAELHYDFHPAWVVQQLRAAGFVPQERLSISLFRQRALKRIFPTAWLVTLDSLWQPVAAPLTLGPSVFVSAQVERHGPCELVPKERLFRCPRCGYQPLQREGAGMHCAACAANWPIENGVYIFK